MTDLPTLNQSPMFQVARKLLPKMGVSHDPARSPLVELVEAWVQKGNGGENRDDLQECLTQMLGREAEATRLFFSNLKMFDRDLQTHPGNEPQLVNAHLRELANLAAGKAANAVAYLLADNLMNNLQAEPV